MLQSIITKASKSVAPDFTVLAHTFCNPGALGHLGIQMIVTLYPTATYEDPRFPISSSGSAASSRFDSNTDVIETAGTVCSSPSQKRSSP